MGRTWKKGSPMWKVKLMQMVQTRMSWKRRFDMGAQLAEGMYEFDVASATGCSQQHQQEPAAGDNVSSLCRPSWALRWAPSNRQRSSGCASSSAAIPRRAEQANHADISDELLNNALQHIARLAATVPQAPPGTAASDQAFATALEALAGTMLQQQSRGATRRALATAASAAGSSRLPSHHLATLLAVAAMLTANTVGADDVAQLQRTAANQDMEPPPAASAVPGVEGSSVMLPSRVNWAAVPLAVGSNHDKGELPAAAAAAAIAAATSHQLQRFGLDAEHWSRWAYVEAGMAAYGLAASAEEALRCQLACMLARGHDAFVLDLIKAGDVPDGVPLPPPVLIQKGGDISAYVCAKRSLGLLAEGVMGRYSWAAEDEVRNVTLLVDVGRLLMRCAENGM